MNAQIWLTLIGSAGIPVIVTAILKLIENRSSLKSAKPKSDAEALDIGIGSQKRVIETLTAENARLDAKVQRVESEATAREERLSAAYEDTRRELANTETTLQGEISKLRREHRLFRDRVETLLIDSDIDIPSWWTMTGTRPPEAGNGRDPDQN